MLEMTKFSVDLNGTIGTTVSVVCGTFKSRRAVELCMSPRARPAEDLVLVQAGNNNNSQQYYSHSVIPTST